LFEVAEIGFATLVEPTILQKQRVFSSGLYDSPRLALLVLLLLSAAFASAADNITVKNADVDGMKIHCMTAGHGPAVLPGIGTGRRAGALRLRLG
jgi:hypothetical protein